MKRLVISAVVAGFIFTAGLWASTLRLVIYVDGEPYCGQPFAFGTPIDVYVVQDVPNPDGTGGEITVTMSASGGSATDTTPQFNTIPYAGWDWLMNGGVAFFDNGDGTWSAWMGKTALTTSPWGMPGTPGIGSWIGYAGYGGWAYLSTMEFSFVPTMTTELVFGGSWDGVNYDGIVGGTIGGLLHPGCCYGDVTNDWEVSIADLSAIVGFLSPYAGTTPPYTVCPAPPGFANADVTGDGCISIADLSAIVAYITSSFPGWPYTLPCMESP
ncbi:MAG: dockerin type I repeat-containing protein [Planctomycetota bacterium]